MIDRLNTFKINLVKKVNKKVSSGIKHFSVNEDKESIFVISKSLSVSLT